MPEAASALAKKSPLAGVGASTVRDGTNSSACAGRPRSPSATATRTARRVGLPLTPPTSLPDDVDQVAEQRVARGDDARVRLERALRADQVDELLRDLHDRLLERRGDDGPVPLRARGRDRRRTRGDRRAEGLISCGNQSLRVRK